MTTQFHPPDPSVLKNKVVVLTGGALGVGAATVRMLHAAGAHIVFGDVLDTQGRALQDELNPLGKAELDPSGKAKPMVEYVHCDVTSYEQNLLLFDTALVTFGRVDHAVAIAGLGEQLNMFDPNLTLDSVREEPTRSMSVVDVNLKGPLYFARLASVYLRHSGPGDSGAGDRSLTLISSVAGFREDPGLYVYVAAKHGVMGLMRVLRNTLIKRSPCPIRTNAICPWMTKTRLVAGIEDKWEEAGLPSNTPEDIARVILGVLADSTLNGSAMYVEGGRAWDIEAGLKDLRPQWIGERQNSDLDKGTALMLDGEHWIAGQT